MCRLALDIWRCELKAFDSEFRGEGDSITSDTMPRSYQSKLYLNYVPGIFAYNREAFTCIVWGCASRPQSYGINRDALRYRAQHPVSTFCVCPAGDFVT